ncbi:MAG: asparagine synthase (glutamine-hydrolyzing) [Desulfovibrio sp.]|nr:asparagine synthase (glutamine-hydrolyzing) [Desulfovibrio sp.]
MCGIAGLCRLDGKPLPAGAALAVKAMTDVMAHRGPDGEGQWQEGPVCLGHRRLSIIDIAGGTQPMPGPHGKSWIVFNGEIYNFRELRKLLESRGLIFRNNSDTEVILAAYAAWGVDCLERLEGMFAFALWDCEKRRLFCARDHFGKKPFYYSLQNGIFAFASELTGLEQLETACKFADWSFSVSPQALMRYLAYEYVPAPQAIYSEAKVLEPAHYLLLENGSLQTRRYWDLPAPASSCRESERELCGQLHALLDRAVQARMVSDVPLGVFLSGGIDSTIVAGLMAAHSSQPVRTFSIGFTEASYDESRYARIAAEAYHTDHHERILSAAECADELPGIVRRMDTPMADASCAPTWLLSGLARENVTVALGGDGADELWAGYEHYIGFRIALWYNALPAFLRSLAGRLATLLPESAGYINPRLAARTFLAGAAAPDWLRVQTMLTAISPEMQRQILAPGWPGPGGVPGPEQLFAPTRKQFEHWQPMQAASPLARAFHVYCRQFLLDDILVKVDRCSMLHSLEVRAPFLDRHVAEFAARLPLDYKLRGFRRKYLLKKAFAKLLPAAILKRNKRGFQIPVAAWLRGRLKPLLLEFGSRDFLEKQGIFDYQGVRKIMAAHFSEKADMRKPLWTFLVLQLWLESRRGRLRP